MTSSSTRAKKVLRRLFPIMVLKQPDVYNESIVTPLG